MEATTRPEPRTAKATRAAQLAAQRKRAAYLQDRGWICIAPGTEESHEVGSLLADIYVTAEGA